MKEIQGLRVESGIGENPLLKNVRPHTFIIHTKSVDIQEEYQGGNWHVVKNVAIELTPEKQQDVNKHNLAHYTNDKKTILKTRVDLPIELLAY